MERFTLIQRTTIPAELQPVMPHIAAQQLVVRDVEIEGWRLRYSLADLHKAAGGAPEHDPALWLATPAVAASLADLPNVMCVTRTRRGEVRQFVTRDLAYAYAAWVGTAFLSRVIDGFDKAVTAAVLTLQVNRY